MAENQFEESMLEMSSYLVKASIKPFYYALNYTKVEKNVDQNKT